MHIHPIAIILCGVLLPPLMLADTGNGAAAAPSAPGSPSPARIRLSQADVTRRDEQNQRDYLESVTREAAQSDAASAQPSAGVGQSGPAATVPTPAPITGPRRFDAIRGIVSEALAVPKTEKAEVEPEEEISPPVAEQRRQRLQEVVISAPPPKDSPGDNYISILKDEGATTVVVEPGSTSETTAAAGSAGQKLRDTYLYTVRYGDSLWTIAERVYGDGYLWGSIYEANRDTIANANSLRVGQQLKLPKD